MLGVLLMAAAGSMEPAEATVGREALLRWSGPPAAQDSWVEVTPLDSNEAARVYYGPRLGSLLRLGSHTVALVCVGAEGLATRCVRAPLSAGAVIEAAPVHGTQLIGRVLHGRQALAGARISVVPADLDSRRSFAVPLERDRNGRLVRDVATDSDGHFTIRQLAPGRFRLEITFPTGPIRHSEVFDVPVAKTAGRSGRAPQMDLGELVFDEGLTMHVAVLDEDGDPVIGAAVGGVQAAISAEIPHFSEARTTVSGIALLSGLDPGLPLTLRCRASGFITEDMIFDSPPGSVELRLRRPAGLEGQVVTEAGEPAEGATIAIRPSGGTVTSGRRGEFAFSGLVPGEYDIVASRHAERSTELRVALTASERKRLLPLTLYRGKEATGLVLDAKSRKGVAGAVVRSTWPPGAIDATTDADGRFTFSHPNEPDSAPAPVEIDAPGYPQASMPLPSVDDEGQVVLEIAKGGRIRVEAWDDSRDEPCLACSIVIQKPGGTAVILSTDGSGVAESGLLSRGYHRVVLERVRSLGSVVQVQGGATARDVIVEPEVTKTVTFGPGRGHLEVRVRAAPRGWLLVAASIEAQQVWEQEPDESYRIVRSLRYPTQLFLSNGAGVQVFAATVAREFEEPTLDITLPLTEVSGILASEQIGRAGVALTIVEAASGQPSAWARTDDSGSFIVPYLRPGSYALRDSGGVLQTFTVVEGQPKNLGEVARVGTRP